MTLGVVCPSKTKKHNQTTQCAEKWSCMGKWAVPCWAILFLGLQKGPRRSDYSGDPFAVNPVTEKG